MKQQDSSCPPRLPCQTSLELQCQWDLPSFLGSPSPSQSTCFEIGQVSGLPQPLPHCPSWQHFVHLMSSVWGLGELAASISDILIVRSGTRA